MDMASIVLLVNGWANAHFFICLFNNFLTEKQMYDSDANVLGATAVAAPALLGLGLTTSNIIYTLIGLALLIALLYGIYKFRNRKNTAK